MQVSVALSIAAGLLHIVAFVFYNKQMLQKTSCPNAATWTLWVSLTILNVTSYKSMSGDWIKAILPITSSAACILTYMFATYKGKFFWPDKWDSIVFATGAVAGLVWWYFQSATYANLILQISIAISFVPTLRGVWSNPQKEKAAPWLIWGTAYILMIAVICLRWQPGHYKDLVYPINCLVLHSLVATFAMRKSLAIV